MKKLNLLLMLIFVISIFSINQNLFPQSSGYKVVGKIVIGGESRWDYLSIDTVMHRLYVSHMSQVDIIDLNKGTVIGIIPNLNGVHGIAFAQEFNKGFISNGKDNSVTVFNLKTMKVIANVKVPAKGPDAIVYDPFSKRVFTFNGHSDNATAIDANSNKVVGNVELDGGPEFAVSNHNGKMFVNLEDKSMIEEFDPKTLKKVNVWSILPCKSPSALSIDLKTGLLFSGCRNKLIAVVDSKSGKLMTSLPIGAGVDADRFDPVDNYVFASCGEGILTVIKVNSPEDIKVIDNITTTKGARTMAFDKSADRIYLAAMISGNDNKQQFGVLILAK